MISSSFDLHEFVDAVKDKDRLEIISIALQEVHFAEQQSFSIKGAVRNRANGSTRYAAYLKGLIFLLTEETSGNASILPFRKICESLVQRKQLRPEIMKLFGNYITLDAN